MKYTYRRLQKICECRTEMFAEMTKRIADKMNNYDDMKNAIDDLWRKIHDVEINSFFMGIHEESYVICDNLENGMDENYSQEADWYIMFQNGDGFSVDVSSEINADCIKEQINDAINNIIRDWQDKLGIKSGDIELSLDMVYEETIDKLRDVVVSILEYQETWCKD